MGLFFLFFVNPLSVFMETVYDKKLDNRDNSLDSRFWGFVPRNHIIGEALFAYFSLDISSFPYIPRFDRIGTIIQ